MGITLPFTYPPVAAVLFTPLTLVPLPVAGVLLTVLSLGMLGLVVRPAWGIVLPAAVVLEPVRATLSYGQINVLLMALVVLDCLVRNPRWPRGVLVGLAAAVKLTPAGFGLVFLLGRDRRAAVRAAAAFLGATLAGFMLAGKDSVRYWSVSIYDPGRVGTIHYAGNQSLLGVLARLGLAPPVRTVVWMIGVVVVLAVAVIGIRRAIDAGNVELAVGFNALAVLACSPVSWSHHWVWVVPVLLGFWRLRSPLALALGAAGLVVFVCSPQWWWLGSTANREYEWNLGQQLLGNAYLYFAVVVLTVSGRLVADARRPDPVPAVAAPP